MSGEEKMRAKKEQASGKVKEAAGRAVGNESLTAKGRAEQVKGDARAAKEKIKDAVEDAKGE
ncbi:CsbD family protein [Streptomyces sp. NBC_01408]|uniref:CsbD family protein n=1 Tax=Streptomyces sp. NBC_01408 TaxID=2903855 RepID=UPI002255462A|nr:CsbD family protein [Streptomyces sp. NBC_01408]MCX4696081.1 CsbD family protein [Streptomyces sp. NBC_01408]